MNDVVYKLMTTILFVGINFFAYQKIKRNKPIAPLAFTLVCLILIVTFTGNLLTELNRYKQEFVIMLFLTISLILLMSIGKENGSYLKKRYEEMDSLGMDYYLKGLDFIKYKGTTIVITLYQILLIWNVLEFPIK